MSYRVSPAVAKILGRLSGSAKAVAQTGNNGMEAMADSADPRTPPAFMEGTIVRVGPSSYDATVLIPNYGAVGCNMLANAVTNLVGASSCTLPSVGSRVLVYLPDRRAIFGTIIGVIPPHDTLNMASEGKPPQGLAGMWELESSTTGASESGYSGPVRSDQFIYNINSGSGRPLDLMPGSYAVVNDQGAGVAVTPLAATLKAGSRAQIRCGVVDDNVRIVAGFFQHFDAAGALQTFNDNGYVTEERGVTAYQCERSGMKKLGQRIFDVIRDKTLNSRSLNTSIDAIKKRMVPKKRMQTFTGFMGDILNLFIANPDPDVETETEDGKSKDQGLMHVHADASGRLHIKAANGILLQRSDRIPVPKRVRQPWDPEGDQKIQPPPERTPWQWDKAHPYGRSLQSRDANAWRSLEAYWHLHNQSQSTGHKDFYIPEESELKVPQDKFDEPGNASADFAANDKRQAAISIEDDGSIMFRDAWGSEIIMRGGNIIFNCPGQLEVRSGKSTVIMGGHDVVIKARESVDVTATEKDVRVKAEKNLHMAGTGVLVESTAKGNTKDWDKLGEEIVSSGVVLRAKESTVLAAAKRTHLSGSKELTLETFGGGDGESDSNDGEINVSANRINVLGKTNVTMAVGETSGVHIGTSGVDVASPTTVIASTGTTAIVQAGKYMVPLKWADLEGDVCGQVQEMFRGVSDRLGTPDFLSPYTPSERINLYFSYRTSPQYGTIKPSEIEGGTKFFVYQPFWAVMAKCRAKTVPTLPEGWKEQEIEGTYPWPGKEARDKAYVILPGEVNVDSDTGISKNRNALQNEGAPLEIQSFDEYEVTPHKE